ncbi:hypothetical protein IU440_28870 [Nocardia cyriacigeorgica]|uniref:phage tail fiber protein n=1 Tax=Nocardia cyriacigeorgica TaxID=135487 RepID=UPI00189421EA|nr:hypothetical protein [Nocardia cyriacigeorgica]MBF6428692.1 hypothetical protein [Nocardia cyriacigeorgica]
MSIRIAATRIARANDYTADVALISLHTASPGAGPTPANEVSGGSPAYARKAPSWGGATDNGTVATAVAGELEFDVPIGTSVTHVGYLDASGNLVDWIDSADISFSSAQGKLRVTPKYTQA